MAGEGQLAREVRAGLGVNMHLVEGSVEQQKVGPLDEISFGKPIRKHVWEFACIFAVIGCVVAGWLMHKHAAFHSASIILVASAALLGLGAFAPAVLHPVWKGWMWMAHYLGVIMSTVIVTVAWVAMLVPVAILLKIIGKRVMDLSFDRSVASYWEEREEKLHNFELLERQF